MSEELRGLPKQADQAIALINELHTERLQYSEYTLLIEAAMSLALYETHVPALLDDNARLQSELAEARELANFIIDNARTGAVYMDGSSQRYIRFTADAWNLLRMVAGEEQPRPAYADDNCTTSTCSYHHKGKCTHEAWARDCCTGWSGRGPQGQKGMEHE
jgi:hypothetical protein